MNYLLLSTDYDPNNIWLYVVYVAIILVVIAESLWYFVKAYKRAKALKMDADK